MANIIQTFPAGGGSGHTILDGDGTALAQEKNLKITGLSVTDNPGDESTDLVPASLNEDSLNDVCNGSIGTNFITPSFNYSTNEQIVGRWVNGKPIYQKTYVFPTISTSNSLGMTINPENIINFFGTVTNVENECLTLNCAHPNYQDIYGLLTCIKSSTIEVRSINSREWSLSNLRSMKVTIQYTKDTD